jgi:hypothetical protein
MIEITDEYMPLAVDSKVIATTRFGQQAAADGNGAWIVSIQPARLFTGSQAIRAPRLAERLAHDHGDDDLFVRNWREELLL